MRVSNIHSFKSLNSCKSFSKKKSPCTTLNSKLQNANLPIFCAKAPKNQTSSFILPNEIRIPNLLDINEDIIIPRSKMPKGQEKYNAAGLNIIIDTTDESKTYHISNDKGDVIAIAKFQHPSTEMPTVIYKQGKYMPELTIKDSSLGDKAIKMMAGSELKAPNFEIKMFGQFEPTPHNGYKQVSFSGKSTFVVQNMEAKTKEAIDLYLNNEYACEVSEGDYKDLIDEYSPEAVCIATGKDDRLNNISRHDENKYSIKIPTEQNHRAIGLTLNLLAAAGLIRPDDDENNVAYLSQGHQLPKSKNIHWIDNYQGNTGAISQALLQGIIDPQKDLIIVNADIFTNADLTRAYHSLKTLPQAAIVVPYFPISPEKADAYSLLNFQKDNNGNLQVKKIITNPQYTIEAPDPNDYAFVEDYDSAMLEYDEVQNSINPKNKEEFLANSGMYFLSKEALRVLMAQGIINPQHTDMSKDVIPKIIELINEKKLTDKDGNVLKIYTVPLEQKGGNLAVVDDINTAQSYLKLVKDIAYETKENGIQIKNKYYGMPEFLLLDFASNTDLSTGIVFDSYEAKIALAAFKSKYNINTIQGNIYIAGK